MQRNVAAEVLDASHGRRKKVAEVVEGESGRRNQSFRISRLHIFQNEEYDKNAQLGLGRPIQQQTVIIRDTRYWL